jgi:DNA-binding NarL/FixJ family response regulator
MAPMPDEPPAPAVGLILSGAGDEIAPLLAGMHAAGVLDEIRTVAAAPDLARDPDVRVVVLVQVPFKSIAEAVPALKQQSPHVRILSARFRVTPTTAIIDLENGVDGVIDLAHPIDVEHAVRAALGYGSYVPPRMQAIVATTIARRTRAAQVAEPRMRQLLAREQLVLHELLAGRHQDDIVTSLAMTPHEVRRAVDRIKDRLGVRSQKQAIELARLVQARAKVADEDDRADENGADHDPVGAAPAT